MPLIFSQTDVVILKLKDLEISTSDGIGIGQQMTLKIRGVGFDMFNAVAEQHPPYAHGNPLTPGTLPYFPVLFSKKLPDTDAIIEYGQRDIELFILSVEPISTTGATFGSPPDSYKVILRVEIYEEDPTYDDQSTFTYTYYIPYRSEVIYQDLFEVTHFTSFNEGPIRQTVNVQFTFKFEYVLIKQFNEVELIIYTYRNHIKQAASRFPSIPASLVAAIIYDEIYHRDYFDDAQDYESPLQINQNVLIEKFVEVIYEIKYEGNDDERTTLGIGQISVEGLKKLRRLRFPGYSGLGSGLFCCIG